MTRARVDEVIGQGMHRFLGDGVHYRDLLDIRAAMDDWSQWCTVWSHFLRLTSCRRTGLLLSDKMLK